MPQALVPAIIRGVGARAVKTVYNDWRAALAEFMRDAQEYIKFGNYPEPNELPEQLETDEFVVRGLKAKDVHGHTVTQWQEFVQMKRRGDRKSLYIAERAHDKSVSARNSKGFTVPPPYTKQEWEPLASSRALANSMAINHTDGLPTYKKNQPRKWTQDAVAHGRPRSRGGPEFTGSRMHATPSGLMLETIGGTQSVDAIGGNLKRGGPLRERAI